MLKRKIYNQLLDWKRKEHKKALILLGARQVGKTYIVNELAKQYESFISLNFLEQPTLKIFLLVI